jgi:molybdate transport system ATP-binding protein
MELNLDVSKNWPAQEFCAEMIFSGERLGLCGPAQSGKSTLAELIAGQVEADSGRVELNGRVLEDVRARVRVLPEDRQVGLVSPNTRLLQNLTVYDNLLSGYARLPQAQAKLTPAKVIRALALEPWLQSSVSDLSVYEQQQVAVGRALLSNPQLLILDELFSTGDETGRAQLLRRLREGCTACETPYLYISQSLEETQLMADDVILMAAGRVQERLLPGRLAGRLTEVSRAGYMTPFSLAFAEKH